MSKTDRKKMKRLNIMEDWIIEYMMQDIDIKKLAYEIFDEEWIEWMQKIFWYFFRTAIPAEKRIKDLKTIHNVYRL